MLWKENPCTVSPNPVYSNRLLCMEVFLVQVIQNSVSLREFFQPVLSWGTTEICGAISNFCDPINANPYGNYLNSLPQNAPTPADNSGCSNVLGQSKTCLAYNIAAAYDAVGMNETDALPGICASAGPAGSQGAQCVPEAVFLMDPQQESYSNPPCTPH